MKKYKALLFDFDGTVVDTNELIELSWQHTAQVALGRRLNAEEYLSTYGIPLSICMKEFARKYNTKQSAQELIDIYSGYQQIHGTGPMKPFDGIKEALAKLKAKGIKCGIVTSRLKASTIAVLDRYELMKYFDALVCADDTNIHKPNPEPALLCCEKLGVKPEDAIMAGDSVFDLLCGKNAGCAACFVEYSVCTTTEKAIAVANPEFIIKTPLEFAEIVD